MGFFRLLSRLPLGVLYRLGYPVYLLAYYVIGFRRALTHANLKAAFPDKDEREIRRLAKRCYRNFADVFVEMIKSITMNEEELRRRVILTNPELAESCLGRTGRPLLMLAAHQCNWEWLYLASCVALPFPVDAVYKQARNELLETFQVGARSRLGGRLIPSQDFIMEIMRRGREARAYAMVADQTPLRTEEKHWTRFLHRDTAFFVGPQKIARLTKATVLFIRMRRVRRGHYEATFELLAEPPYEAEGYPIIEHYARLTERQALEAPADWLWLYNKWKYKKPLYA